MVPSIGPMTPHPAFEIFQGAPGQVTVSDRNGDVGVTGMQFFVDGYSVVGDPITLADPQTAIVVGDGTSASAGMSAVISAPLTGIGGLVKRDLGTLTLAGQNSYAGGTVIEAGTLAVSSDGGLGDSLGGLTFDGGTLRFGADVTSDRTVSLDDGGGTVDTDGFRATLGGSIDGVGALTKVGRDRLRLTGTGSYSGPTLIDAGTLQAGIADAFSASSAYTVGSGATLDLADLDQTIGSLAGSGNVTFGSATLTTGGDNRSTAFDGILSGQGGLTKVGTGTFTLDGDGSGFDGQTAVDAGTLLVGGPLGTGSVSVQDGATLGGSGIIGGDVSVSGTLQGIQGQTLTMGSLTLGSPARTDVTLGTPGGASLFDVGGDLTLDGT